MFKCKRIVALVLLSCWNAECFFNSFGFQRFTGSISSSRPHAHKVSVIGLRCNIEPRGNPETKQKALRRDSSLDNLRQRSAEGNSGHGYTAVMIVPTGIGASIGGFAGDALPTARAMASVVDNLITHPNVMNGASLYWPIPNALYTEGYALDCFAEGEWGLLPLHHGGHRIGLLLDKGMSEDLILRHVQAADAARATLVRRRRRRPREAAARPHSRGGGAGDPRQRLLRD